MSPAEIDEAQLIRDSIAGHHPAFNELVRRHRSFVLVLAYRLCGDRGQAEDIAQDVFVRVWEALPGFRFQAAFRSWLYRIATNVALERLRRVKPAVGIDTLPLAAGDVPEDSAIRSELCRTVRAAILQLPPQSRVVLVLREYEGLSYKDISSTLDIPIGTVMSRLNYARQRLREDLIRYIQPEEGRS